MVDHPHVIVGVPVTRRAIVLQAAGIALGAIALSACGGSATATTSAGATTSAAATASAAAPSTAAPSTASAAASSAAASAAPVATTSSAAATAASATQSSAGVNTGAVVAQPGEVVFNTWWVPLQDIFTELIKSFQAANPGVTIKTQMITANYIQKMAAALVAGNFGDAATTNNNVQTKWMSSGYHYDLTSWVNEDKLDLEHNYSLGGLEIWCGKVLNMPYDNDDRAVYYNKTMIKAAGAKDPWDDLHGKWTWDDLIEIGKKCTKADSSGKTTQYGFEMPYSNTQLFESFVWSLGGNYVDWNTGKFNYLDPAVVKAQEILYNWATVDKFMITNQAISNLQGASGINPFRAGLVAMYWDASYDATLNEKQIGSKFEWDAAPVPDPGSFNPGKPGVPQSTANPNFVPKSAKNAQGGYKWLAYLCNDAAENLYATKKTTMVAKLSAWKAYQDAPPPTHAGSFVYYVFSRPHGFHYYSDLTNDVFYSVVQVELDKAYLGQQTIQQALQNAQKKIDTMGPSQTAPCPSPYGANASPRPPMSAAELSSIGVHPYM